MMIMKYRTRSIKLKFIFAISQSKSGALRFRGIRYSNGKFQLLLMCLKNTAQCPYKVTIVTEFSNKNDSSLKNRLNNIKVSEKNMIHLQDRQ